MINDNDSYDSNDSVLINDYHDHDDCDRECLLCLSVPNKALINMNALCCVGNVITDFCHNFDFRRGTASRLDSASSCGSLLAIPKAGK